MKLTVWISGKLMNFSNVRQHWTATAAYKRVWRQKVRIGFAHPVWDSARPKCIIVAANVWNLYDAHDGLPTACKPIIDGLIDAGIIHSDAPGCGHTFAYVQEINRRQLGVTITVEAP